MKNINFYKGKLNQWSYYSKNETKIWVAGHRNNTKCIKILKLVEKLSKINIAECKKILSFLGDHFGIIIITPNWTFAAVDYARCYPIFWIKGEKSLLLASTATLLKKKEVDLAQLIAFRMSGYTISDGTLWQNIKSLNFGSFLFFDNKNNLVVKKYFNYIPYQNFNYSYIDYKKKLKKEIEFLFQNIIKKVNGKNIIIPLSAGLDSRLIASGLKHFKYKNVKCFSYGIKNNYEAIASKKIADKLGYEWRFVKITHRKAKDFYNSNKYKRYLKDSADGCATSTIQGLFAIDSLLKLGFIEPEDVIINGNSGDFISGGHINKNVLSSKVSKKNINIVINSHYSKHYSLWDTLKTAPNKSIIKKRLLDQINSGNIKKASTLYGILEFLEYENRQTKYVINCQRIYEFYNLNWLLPLWSKSFINFWEGVPLYYKLNQKLYKETLRSLNYGDVWTKHFDIGYRISPKWMLYVRFFFKVFFFFIGKKKWRDFEKKYLNYWTENIYGFSSIKYFSFIQNKNIARNYVSIYTLQAEKQNLGNNWQNT